jgi:hypothetical protein
MEVSAFRDTSVLSGMRPQFVVLRRFVAQGIHVRG